MSNNNNDDDGNTSLVRLMGSFIPFFPKQCKAGGFAFYCPKLVATMCGLPPWYKNTSVLILLLLGYMPENFESTGKCTLTIIRRWCLSPLQGDASSLMFATMMLPFRFWDMYTCF